MRIRKILKPQGETGVKPPARLVVMGTVSTHVSIVVPVRGGKLFPVVVILGRVLQRVSRRSRVLSPDVELSINFTSRVLPLYHYSHKDIFTNPFLSQINLLPKER